MKHAVKCLLIALVVCGKWGLPGDAAEKSRGRVAIVVGPSNHPPGTHEVAAGARLLQHCLEHPDNVAPFPTVIWSEWPRDKSQWSDVATIVFVGDIFPPEKMPEPDRIKAELKELMSRGCGLVCLHFATGLRAEHVAADGDHPLLEWLGGYYSSGCPHHKSQWRVCEATVTPVGRQHPVERGWREFTLYDEPYWSNYFGKTGMAANVVPLAETRLPPEDPQRHVVAWAVERADGGRGVGIVMPHFFGNWRLDDLRTLILNGVCWTAQTDVPSAGVKATLPELETFQPTAVEPPAKKAN